MDDLTARVEKRKAERSLVDEAKVLAAWKELAENRMARFDRMTPEERAAARGEF